MPRLNLTLLGSPQISIDNVPVKGSSSRAVSLLAYLALTNSRHTRETIANLLWSESNLPLGLASLRTALWRMKSAGLDGWLHMEGDEIGLNLDQNIDVDVIEFKTRINHCTTHGHPQSQVCLHCIPSLTAAAELYHGEFMAGWNVINAQVFDNWRIQVAEDLQILYIDVLERLSKGHRTLGEFNRAIQYSRLLLREDPYNENAQYDLLQLYFLTGQRAAAINQYRRYQKFLSRELSIHPSEELIGLYKHILAGRESSITASKTSSPNFLFADIENASEFWIHAGNRRADFISAYQNIFKETANRFGGYLLQKSDDRIILLFNDGQPLNYAITVHLRLKKLNWGLVGPPKVRMLVYSVAGTDGRNNDFSSIPQAATNLLAMCWGDQIIFTEQTRKQVTQPPGSRVRDLGFHAVRDIREPVHIFELLHPQLPFTQHQPLVTRASNLVNFPDLTPAFIGREAEMNQLSTLIDSQETRILSLVGPGGVGKTRLAVQFASQVSNRFSDGVFFISLASIQDPDFIPIVMADTLRFNFYGNLNHLDQICAYLHRMNALLVFDNFEHIRLEGSKILTTLVNQTHFLKIIVTSRERLNLVSEHSVDLMGLNVPASVVVKDAASYSSIRLFHNNALKISPWFDLEENLADVVRICHLVNGLPLGIILASSWVRIYSCQHIAQKISRNIDFLTSSSQDIPPRQRSLRVVFDNTWRLLSERERITLRHLSIFPAAFSSLAAEKICSAYPQLLADYLDKSVLILKHNRYEMLDTFRQYTLEKLMADGNEFNSVREKYLAYYIDFCIGSNQVFNSSVQRRALDEMSAEFENILGAWEWMIDLKLWDDIDKLTSPLLTYYVMTGNFSKGREFFRHALEKLIKNPDPANTKLLAIIQQLEAWMAVRIGYLSEGLKGLTGCLDTMRKIDSPMHLMMTIMFIADAHRLMGDPRLGKKYIEEALHLLDQPNLAESNFIVALRAHCLSIYGQIWIDLGGFDQAIGNLQASLEIHIQIGTHYGSLAPLQGLAKVACIQGDFSHAKNLYLQALETATQINLTHSLAIIHNNLGSVYADMASPLESHHHLLTALMLCKETGDRRLLAVILNNLAYHQWRYLGQPAEAIRTYHESIQIFADNGDLRGMMFSYYDVSKAYLNVGLVDEAREFTSRALDTASILDNLSLILHALHGFALLFADLGERERALGLCYLLENHPALEPDTRKRVIVTRIQLETILPIEVLDSARRWGETVSYQAAIEQILAKNNLSQ